MFGTGKPVALPTACPSLSLIGLEVGEGPGVGVLMLNASVRAREVFAYHVEMPNPASTSTMTAAKPM